jgi:hypothetical protein
LYRTAQQGAQIARDPPTRAVTRDRDELDLKFTEARTVEFGEEDYLPATESEAALLDKYRFGGADQRGFDMRI